MIGEQASSVAMKEGLIPLARNMIIPIATMVILMPTFLIMTGWADGEASPFKALQSGSGSKSVLYATSFACALAIIIYKLNGVLSIRESFDLSLKGMSGMVPLAILMVLAFTIGSLCKELGTGPFSTGTSWGTFAIMIAIAVPLAQGMDTNISLAIAAALGGGIFGDHCSPTSDTSIITSMATANDHIDHIRTQLPYALIGGGLTTALYLILGALGV